MTVSAIIPTYNRRAYIRRAIDSVLAQTAPVDEIILIDDGSTDGTADAVEAWFGDRVRVIRQQNTGVSGARHRGIREARGEWIAFLDSDDEWTPDRNRELYQAAMRVPPDVAWIFGDLRIVTDAGEQKSLFEEFRLHLTESPHVFADPLSVQFPFQFGLLQGSYFRRSALVDLDCFAEGLQNSEDLLAGFQVACRHRVAAVMPVVGKYYRTSDLAASSMAVNGLYGADYFRARMLAFGLVAETVQRRPWNRRYASEVRGYCKVLARKGPVSRRLAFQQFQYGGLTLKGIAFFCTAMPGRWGIQAWNAVAAGRRNWLGLKARPKSAGTPTPASLGI
jgi:glycosyltransferase involved in cell wall biosynthesis